MNSIESKKGDAPELERVNITCGDIAANTLRKCGAVGQCLAWRDLLLIGPLPRLESYQEFFLKRAEYIKGWTQLDTLPSAEEMAGDDILALENTLPAKAIVFWVWPMLSNHTMLLCLLDWYQQHNYQGELRWVDASKELGRHDEEYISTLIDSDKRISQEQISYAQSLWEAIRQPTPERLVATLRAESEHFPHMNKAFWRYLEELPNTDNGLSHLQQKVLEAIDEGYHSPRAIYKYAHQDEKYFMVGDWYFWHLINRMINVAHPLIRTSSAEGFQFPPRNISEDFDMQHLSLSTTGRQVLTNEKCHVSLNGNKRPWGGIEFDQLPSWRYNPSEREVLRVD